MAQSATFAHDVAASRSYLLRFARLQLRNDVWEPIGGAGVKIAVDPSGNPWVVSAAAQVMLRWNLSAACRRFSRAENSALCDSANGDDAVDDLSRLTAQQAEMIGRRRSID